MNTIRQWLLLRSEIKNDVKIKHEMHAPDNNVTPMSCARRKSDKQNMILKNVEMKNSVIYNICNVHQF